MQEHCLVKQRLCNALNRQGIFVRQMLSPLVKQKENVKKTWSDKSCYRSGGDFNSALTGVCLLALLHTSQ